MTKIDNRDPKTLVPLKVVDLSTGQDIPDIVYADDEIGTYAVWKRKNNYDRDIEIDAQGNPIVIEHSPGRGAFRIIRR